MQPTDSGSPEKAIPVAVIGQEQQASAQARGLLRTFIALRHRNYRLFFFGQMISQIGTWMQTTAQAWLVLELTHSALLLGLVGVLQFLPLMVLSLFGGVLADRVPKRTLLLVAQSVAFVQATILWLLVVTGTVRIWHILLLVALLGVTQALDTPTRQAFVGEMVGREDLPNAIALNSSLVNMARVLGPGLGGVLIAWLGVAPLFLLNAISFIAVIIGLIMIDQRELHALPGRQTDDQKLSTFQSLREGLFYVWHMPTVLLVISVVGVIALFGINFNVMLPLFATDVFHAGPVGFGLISAAYGLGALFSALWVAWGNRKPSIRFLLIAAIAFSLLEIAFALSPFYFLSFPLLVGVGFAQVVMTATANTTIQTVTPNYLRGRVISVYLLVYSGGMPVGNLLAGGLTTLFGAPIAFLIGGVPCFVAAIVGWILRKPAERSLAASMTAMSIE
jgi:MFS family permease